MDPLHDARARIDAIDEQLVALLAQRFRIVAEVGHIKAREGIAVVQSDRARAVKDRVVAMARAQGLDGDLLRAIYDLMIDHAHTLENDILKKDRA